jgi:sugar-specific transcriptional regulator TrmB
LSSFLDEKGKILVKLGLSPSQSKIYLALLQLGRASVKEISQVCKIAREDIYKSMPSLLELGLINKHLASPTQYGAVDPKEGFELLLNCVKEQYLNLNVEADKALKDLNATLNNKNPENKNLETTIFSATNNINTLTEAVKEANETIDFTTRYNLFIYSMNSPQLISELREMRKSAERGVKFRMIVNKPRIAEPLSSLSFQLQDSKDLILNKNFEYRYLSSPPKCVVIVYDNKRCLIETSKEQDIKFSPYLWSNNEILVELCKSYFEKNWDLAYRPLKNSEISVQKKKVTH